MKFSTTGTGWLAGGRSAQATATAVFVAASANLKTRLGSDRKKTWDRGRLARIREGAGRTPAVQGKPLFLGHGERSKPTLLIATFRN